MFLTLQNVHQTPLWNIGQDFVKTQNKSITKLKTYRWADMRMMAFPSLPDLFWPICIRCDPGTPAAQTHLLNSVSFFTCDSVTSNLSNLPSPLNKNTSKQLQRQTHKSKSHKIQDSDSDTWSHPPPALLIPTLSLDSDSLCSRGGHFFTKFNPLTAP